MIDKKKHEGVRMEVRDIEKRLSIFSLSLKFIQREKIHSYIRLLSYAGKKSEDEVLGLTH